MPVKYPYQLEKIPRMRRFTFDAGYLGRRRHMVHGLLEVDVTESRRIIRQVEQESGEKLSFTAFVIYCLSRAIEQHPHLGAYRDWRNRLVIFDQIWINSMFEVEKEGKRFPMPHIFRAANQKSLLEIHQEMRHSQSQPHTTVETKFLKRFLYLPAFMRRIFYWFVMRMPQYTRQYSGSVLVTAVGMFGQGGGWAITLPNFTLTVVVGGISKKPGVIKDEIAIREYLDLTLSIDHDIVDGAPAARFAQSLRELLESASGLVEFAETGPVAGTTIM